MSVFDTISAGTHVEVDGVPLDPLTQNQLMSVEIDSSLYVPSQCRLVFRDPATMILLEGGFQLAVMLTVQVIMGGEPAPLFTGEVTAVEIEYGPEGNLTIVRALDFSHRLMRGTKTMAYMDQVASDVVTLLAGEAGIPPGEIIPTDTVYECLSQANVSSWVFIQQLAAMENRVAYVDAEGLFNFCPMPLPAEGLPPVLTYEEPPEATQLVVNRNLIRLRATVTGAEQVEEVNVLGWDPDASIPVVGLFPSVPSTGQSIDPLCLPPVVAGEMGAVPYFDTSRPFTSESAAITRAGAIADDIAGALTEMEGQCIGNPLVVAGASISLGLAGPPFDGQYVCSSARHVFDPAGGGYSTWFTVGGRQDRSLFALASGNNGGRSSRPEIPGVVTGIVVDNEDPMISGRIKVMFPWLGPTYVSAWARTMQIGAGVAGGYGFLWMPEVGDEVLIAFDRGNIDSPYVIGNVYQGIAKPEPPPEIEGAVASRRIMSRMRHQIEFEDGPDDLGITINTGTEQCMVKLDDAEQGILIKAGPGGLTITSEGDLTIQTVGNLTMSAANITMEADASLAMTGTADATIEGGAVTVTGDETVSVLSPLISLGE